MEKAQQFEDEDLLCDRRLFDFAEEYDSDDPRSMGGPYYWMVTTPAVNASISTKLYDIVRYCTFYLGRFLGFLLLVITHFFGFQSRFQWAVDLVEREEIRLEQDAMDRRTG